MGTISSYGIVTGAGSGVDALWNAAIDGRDLSSGYRGGRAFLIPGPRGASVREHLSTHLSSAYREAAPELGPRFGVILASTKGLSNDFIWRDGDLSRDPLTPLLDEFLRAQDLQPEKRLCISNACSSALGALALARIWLAQGLDQVVILAADAVTEFVSQGFQSLKLISGGRPRPFDRARDGFWLGEAAACLVIENAGGIRVAGVELDTEGSVVTRPATSSVSLARALAKLPLAPDAILAHATATPINDETEELAFRAVYGAATPPITGSKWCVGHTLGASAAVDLILACEILKRGRLFALATTQEVAEGYTGDYTLGPARAGAYRTLLVSSLGFGGMHAAALLELRA
ncbi:MAG TPA: beta-ketoacyl synthase N-terminal-like domain-containing protein [Bdellovibrionales bacterium]|nr:beta-ketoacyl synthase N-terminal-like domain-containing protein [Bdellovibrionales bacterium]